MRLVSFTVENYRSITAARQIPVGNTTVLIGPNNEGKSNLLRALATGVTELVLRSDPVRVRFAGPRLYSPPRTRRRSKRNRFSWETDFPIPLQGTATRKKSVITLEFTLSDDEVEEFRYEIGSNINGTLPITLSFGKDSIDFNVVKPGRGHKVLNEKAHIIARFVAARINIQYIPAVRTANAAQDIVETLLSDELSQIENDPKYIQALKDIAELQEPIIEKLSDSIGDTMRQFIPQLKSVKLNIDEGRRIHALRSSAEILADDGVQTFLQYKGDGVQSLAALAMMRHASANQSLGREQIVALEEPESHLHPAAIRELQTVLSDLSSNHQVVITTHNPLFANRADIGSNVIVKNNRAVPAKGMHEIRNVLGVRLADNLTSAETILIVEGDGDKIILHSLLSNYSEKLESALRSGRLSIDVLSGASNLAHRVRMHTDALCKVHVFLDDDDEGRRAFEKANKAGLIDEQHVNFATCAGKNESELEDLLNYQVFDDHLIGYCGYSLKKQGPEFEKKWTDRVRNLLKRLGKKADKPVIDMLKQRVAQSSKAKGLDSIAAGKKGPIDSLAKTLEMHL